MTKPVLILSSSRNAFPNNNEAATKEDDLPHNEISRDLELTQPITRLQSSNNKLRLRNVKGGPSMNYALNKYVPRSLLNQNSASMEKGALHTHKNRPLYSDVDLAARELTQ
jgi:hypothetical protein